MFAYGYEPTICRAVTASAIHASGDMAIWIASCQVGDGIHMPEKVAQPDNIVKEP